MQRHLTHREAWKDFWARKKELPNWINKSRQERAAAYVANQAFNNDALGPVRVQRLLEKYAPERYGFELFFIIKEEASTP